MRGASASCAASLRHCCQPKEKRGPRRHADGVNSDVSDLATESGPLLRVIGVAAPAGGFASLEFGFASGVLSLRCDDDTDEIIVEVGRNDPSALPVADPGCKVCSANGSNVRGAPQSSGLHRCLPAQAHERRARGGVSPARGRRLGHRRSPCYSWQRRRLDPRAVCGRALLLLLHVSNSRANGSVSLGDPATVSRPHGLSGFKLNKISPEHAVGVRAEDEAKTLLGEPRLNPSNVPRERRMVVWHVVMVGVDAPTESAAQIDGRKRLRTGRLSGFARRVDIPLRLGSPRRSLG